MYCANRGKNVIGLFIQVKIVCGWVPDVKPIIIQANLGKSELWIANWDVLFNIFEPATPILLLSNQIMYMASVTKYRLNKT